MDGVSAIANTQTVTPALRKPVQPVESNPVKAEARQNSNLQDIGSALKTVTSKNANDEAGLSSDKQNQQETSPEKIADAVKEMNNFFQNMANRRLEFNIDDKFEEMVVQIKDPDTGEVVRQIPAEEVLELKKRLDEVSGFLFKAVA